MAVAQVWERGIGWPPVCQDEGPGGDGPLHEVGGPEPDRQWDETAWALLHKLRRAMAETEESLRQGSFKNLPDHLFRIKVFFGQLPGQSALVFVTGGDHVQALGCSPYSLESK